MSSRLLQHYFGTMNTVGLIKGHFVLISRIIHAFRWNNERATVVSELFSCSLDEWMDNGLVD